MDPTKPSWQTGEGILTIVITSITVVAGLGLITLTEAATLQEAVKQIGVIVSLAVPTAVSIWKLIQSRTEVKTGLLQARATVEAAHASMGTPVAASMSIMRQP